MSLPFFSVQFSAIVTETNVRFVAFVLKSKPGGSEGVNCHLRGKEANDIHIVLRGSKTDAEECNSVTAEMISHFRQLSQWGL
jgi:hypothetical protein